MIGSERSALIQLIRSGTHEATQTRQHPRIGQVCRRGPHSWVETGTPLTDAQMPPLVECQFLDGESRQTAMAWTNERVVVYREVEA